MIISQKIGVFLILKLKYRYFISKYDERSVVSMITE